MDTRPFLTALNCSIGQPSYRAGLASAAASGFSRVELWWPFASPTPARAEITELVDTLADHGQSLVAMNLWAGDMVAGERGVLHREPLSPGHLGAVALIADATSLPRANLVLGRGGAQLTDAQVERFAQASEWLAERCDLTVMVEPLSGMEDYPVTSLGDVQPLLEAAPKAGLLLDIYHLAANHAATSGPGTLHSEREREGWWDVVASEVKSLGRPEHVQVADVPGRGAPGTGQLPLRRWVEQLRADGYRGEVVGEYLPQG